MKAPTGVLLIMATLFAACGPRTVAVEVPRGYAAALTATPQELIDLINQRYAALNTLTVSNFRVEFTGGSVERGYLKEYPSGKGYLAASRPDSIYLNINNPLTSSTVVAMAASQGEFEIWVPRENKYLTGKTSVRLHDKDPLYSVRPDHLLQGILVEPVPVGDPRYRFFVEQDQDNTRKYYVVGVVDLAPSAGALCLARKIWVDRSDLRLARQRYYDCGEPVSVIEYSLPTELEGGLISRGISVERIPEAYRLRLELGQDAVRSNQTLKENAFHIPKPPGAEVVIVEGDS